ncbi:MAG: zinc ribbon domain-containing protein, partial [Magnetococcales bacterium]|nr:zinc ribbon domain-containing protein [Magnetococcales bacterium]
MKCPHCQSVIREEVRFCTRCGGPLFLLCARCHAPAQEGDLYCGGCGARLVAMGGL